MKRCLFTVLLTGALLLGMVGCSDSPETPEASSTPAERTPASSADPLDISGQWVQSNNLHTEVGHVAYITQDSIEVYWLYTENDFIFPYWTGTLSAAEDGVWVSENQADMILPDVTCTDDVKEFEYKDGLLCYTDITDEHTVHVEMKRTDWDYPKYYAEYLALMDAVNEAMVDSSTEGTDTAPESPSVVPDGMTQGQRNALETALSYLRHSSFSYEGLIDQLEYEKHSIEDATFAADNCGADWNSEALESAKSYIDHSDFSYEGLIDQLEYEEFTVDQAKYGADNCGADWYAEALESAKSYIDHSDFSYEGLIDQLEHEEFTADQAKYGADNCDADWNAEAVESAKSYLSFSPFSRDELIDQLEYEGFTHDQAVYGVEQNGY